MICKQLSGNAGEYYPAFFEMRLKVDSMIDLYACATTEIYTHQRMEYFAVLIAIRLATQPQGRVYRLGQKSIKLLHN